MAFWLLKEFCSFWVFFSLQPIFPLIHLLLRLYSRSKILSRKPQFMATAFLRNTWELFLFHSNGDKPNHTVTTLKLFCKRPQNLQIFKAHQSSFILLNVLPISSAEHGFGPFFHTRHPEMICRGNRRHCAFLGSKVGPTWGCLTHYSIRAKPDSAPSAQERRLLAAVGTRSSLTLTLPWERGWGGRRRATPVWHPLSNQEHQATPMQMKTKLDVAFQ